MATGCIETATILCFPKGGHGIRLARSQGTRYGAKQMNIEMRSDGNRPGSPVRHASDRRRWRRPKDDRHCTGAHLAIGCLRSRQFSQPVRGGICGWRLGLVGSRAPDDRDEHADRWKQALRSGKPFEAQLRLRGADGQYRWFIVRAVSQRDATGQIVSWFGTNTDIDGLQQPEVPRRLREDDLRAAVDSIPTHVWTLHPDGTSDYFNRRRLEYTGPGVDFLAIIHPMTEPSMMISGRPPLRRECDTTRGPLATVRRSLSLVPVSRRTPTRR